VVSAVIVEERTNLAYDFGWTYSGTAWEGASGANYKSLHPVFELRFYPGWSGVEVDAQIWHASMGRFQTIPGLDLALKTGNAEGTTAYSVTGKTFNARSRRHKLTWSGTAPGAVVIDHNFAYLVHTKLIPSYEYGLGVATTLADSDLSTFNGKTDAADPQWGTTGGNWQRAVGTTGARGDIALIPSWYLHYLYLMGNSGVTTAKKLDIWNKLLIGNADAGGSAPFYYMDTDAAKTFFSLQDTTAATGRIVSINARPRFHAADGNETGADGITHPCTASPCSGDQYFSNSGWNATGWTNYASHASSINWLPAFLSGYHYWITGTQMEAAYGLVSINSGTQYINARFNQKGFVYYPDVYRGVAWLLRNVFLGWMLTPDGEIEKAYFKDKLRNNAGYHEGVMLHQSGAHTPANQACPGYSRDAAQVANQDPWCVGKNGWNDTYWAYLGAVTANPLYVPVEATPPYGGGELYDGLKNSTIGRRAGFFVSYVANVMGWIAGSGAVLDDDNQPMFAHVRDGLAAHYAGRVLSSPFLMYMLRHIDWGFGPRGGLPQTWQQVTDGYYTSYPLSADMTAVQTTVVVTGKDIPSGYGWFNTAYAKIDDEYVKLSGDPSLGSTTMTWTISQRGAWGSTAGTHTAGATVYWLPLWWDVYANEPAGGYSVLARAALASLADAKKLTEYSPTTAYHVYAGVHRNASTAYPMWAIQPRERVANVQATGGSGTARINWTAPSGAGCKVYLGATPPETGSDAGDTSATGGGPLQEYVATGLGAGVKHYRITCGTGRAQGTVTVTP
jgi:hypothetical protein